jgi:CRP-like cAMP-binding protein
VLVSDRGSGALPPASTVGSVAETGPIALLREDPELGHGIPVEDWRDAERLVMVPGFNVPVGPWHLGTDHEPSLGVLVLDGLVTINIVLGGRVASQLVGPGDVIHTAGVADALVPAGVSHHVSEPARLAVLDRVFIAAVRKWPALLLALHERLRVQERRLAVHAAVGKMRRIEDRVLALLWHLAERWGRVTGDGVVVPLALTHETIGRLCGAERPTVSLALTELSVRGDVRRRGDGAFVLREGSADVLAPAHDDRPQLRALAVKRTFEASAAQEAARQREAEREALMARLAALRDDLPEPAGDAARTR